MEKIFGHSRVLNMLKHHDGTQMIGRKRKRQAKKFLIGVRSRFVTSAEFIKLARSIFRRSGSAETSAYIKYYANQTCVMCQQAEQIADRRQRSAVNAKFKLSGASLSLNSNYTRK